MIGLISLLLFEHSQGISGPSDCQTFSKECWAKILFVLYILEGKIAIQADAKQTRRHVRNHLTYRTIASLTPATICSTCFLSFDVNACTSPDELEISK